MHPYDFVIATLAVQSLAAMILALLLWLFLRSLEHHYLKQLALAFTALSIHLALSAVGVLSFFAETGGPILTNALVITEIVSFMAFLTWLLMGMHSGLKQQALSTSAERVIIGAAATIGTVLGAGYMLLSGDSRLADMVRVSIPYGIAALVFLRLAWQMQSVRQQFPSMISPVLGTVAFVLSGLFMLYSSVTNLMLEEAARPLFQAPFVSLISLMNLTLVGLSTVIWLLENEQERSRLAKVKALAAEQRLLYFRTHDAATGLPNLRQIENLLSQEMLRVRAVPDRKVAVLALGIHRFKVVSEAIGWQKTNHMVQDLIQRIRDKLPERFVLGRTGERDFIILMPNTRRQDDAVAHAEKILARLRLPFVHEKREFFINVSGGMSIGPKHSDDAAILLNQAHRAQLESASTGQDLVLHQPFESDAGSPANLIQREAELRQACRDGEFTLHFQPLVGIRKRQIEGFEALLRWNHPSRGVLTPDHFLQDAASLGVLDELEDQIFAQALDQLADWHQDFALSPVSVSVNVSAERFQQPDLPEKLIAMCRERDLDPGFLDVELTENAAITDFEAGLDTIQRLRDQGIKVSLDDFGTGYSSLAHLQRLQVDYVKLDRSFVQGIEHDEQQLALTRAVVELIHSLGMRVLAEGVENRSQLGHLIKCRVDLVQGHLLGRPQPAEAFRELLQGDHLEAF
jgi:diguanylate cyclase (GGDEF)-like protein